MYARGQFSKGKWFRQIVVSSDIEQSDFLLNFGLHAQNQNGRCHVIVAQFAANIRAGLAREDIVEKDEVVIVGGCPV